MFKIYIKMFFSEDLITGFEINGHASTLLCNTVSTLSQFVLTYLLFIKEYNFDYERNEDGYLKILLNEDQANASFEILQNFYGFMQNIAEEHNDEIILEVCKWKN